MHTIKSLKNKTITVIISVVIALSLIFGAFAAIGTSARADEVEDISEFKTASLNLSNTDFDSSSGNYPGTPTSWTGAALDNGKGNVVSGVVDLTPSVYSDSKYGNKKFKLDQYDEYKNATDIPQTIFGKNTEYGGDEKALLINTVDGANVAYAYSSGDMTLNPNSFYRFSVWVKTGNFAGATGATVKLSGLGKNFAFNGINTVRNNYNADNELKLDKTNNYGWIKYSMYVRTSASLTKTVKLVLGIGDAVNGSSEDPDSTVSVRPASGYAFFDTVKAEQISAFTFALETEHFTVDANRPELYKRGDNAIAINLNETKSLTTDDGLEVGTFSKNTNLWRKNIYYNEYDNKIEYAGSAHDEIYNSQSRIHDLDSDYNKYSFTQNPWAPYGSAEYDMLNGSPFFADSLNENGENNADIMLITTYADNEFRKAAYGIGSPFVTIERFKYYRFSVWVKSDKVEDGDGITLILRGKAANAKNVTILNSYDNLEGDSADEAHYGWKEQVVYIHGSMLYDYKVSFELWLGTPDARSSGIAMFDNVTFTELKYTDYSEMSTADGGNVYSIDDASNDTNVTNGNFINVGDMDEIKFPMTVADWTYYTTDTVNTTDGFSTKKVDTDTAVHGIIPTDKETVEKNIDSLLPAVDCPTVLGLNNVLLLSSTEKTAFCYQSPSITLATDKANKLTVDLAVARISGYGASLVLKTTDGSVLSTIENITDTNKQFRTYTFYLAAPLSEQTVNVEIWLGLNDRTDNTKKLSSGNVYVKQVALNEWTASDGSTVQAEYDALLEQYKYDISRPSALAAMDYGLYSFTAPSLNYYDAYSYAQDEGFGYLYQWTLYAEDSKNVKGGVFNASYKKNMDIYPGFDAKDLTGNMLYIYNTDRNYTRYTYDNSIALVSNKYYRIDVAVKVNVSDDVRTDKTSVGAGIKLVGSNGVFTNIKDTTTLIDKNNEDSRDKETFKTYSFYISTGDNGGNIGLEITFGGETRESRIQGRLIVGDIAMTEIDNLDYEAAQKSKDKNVMAVELSETNTSDNDNSNTEPASTEIQWWIIPTIIFSAALIAVVILIVVIKIRDRIKSKRKVTYSTEYDRSDVMRDIDRLKAQEEIDNLRQQAEAEKAEQTQDQPEEESDEQSTEESESEASDEESPATEQKPEKKPEQKPAAAPTAADDLDD